MTENINNSLSKQVLDSYSEAEKKHIYFMDRAYQLALKSYSEGGCPIGSVMIDDQSNIIGEGHNMRVQENNPIIHGEMSAMRNAGNRESYKGVTMYTTLTPCMMCSGTIVQFQIPRVIVGDVTNSSGNLDFLKSHGVDLEIFEYQPTIDLVAKFKQENPKLWSEDWGKEYKNV